jgi:hypothetical protein
VELNNADMVQLACAALQAIIRADPKMIRDNPVRVATDAINVAVTMDGVMKKNDI